MESKKGIIFTGAIIGLLASLLVYLGNPGNMGVCIACFIRDISGAIGLHRATPVQYLRPEIMGISLGAFLMAYFNKEFKPKGGSSPFTRFLLGAMVMIGALVFLGCPLRMILRIGGGDLNAVVGLVGFFTGIVVGIFFLNKGFSLKRNYTVTAFEGYSYTLMNLCFIVLLVTAPAFIFFSESGPGSMAAPVMASLGIGLFVGALAQRTRLCMVGGMRDMVLFKDSYLLLGFISIIVFSAIGNMATGKFVLSFANQPAAHTDGLWNFISMITVGWGSVLLGGCPLRQLILSAEGNSDSAVTFMGLLVGAAIAHNFGLASSGKGPTSNGQMAIGIIFALLILISVINSQLVQQNAKKEAA